MREVRKESYAPHLIAALAIDISASLQILQLDWKPSEGRQNDVKKLFKSLLK